MQKELLAPDTLADLIKERRQKLGKVLEIKLKAQKNPLQGHLRIAQPGGGRSPQFYHITNPGDFNGSYIPRAQISFIKKLAQKDYDIKLIKLLQGQLRTFDKLLATTDSRIEQLYSKMTQVRQSLITPVTLTDEQYIEEWQKEIWQGRPFSDDTPDYFTALGERVRSKSEVIIADTLHRLEIPYRYEYPLELKSGQNFYPDFLCLNVRTRQEFLWEHLGMMDDENYLENAVRKIRLYNDNDYFIGKNLLITMETQSTPVNTRQIEQIIKSFLI